MSPKPILTNLPNFRDDDEEEALAEAAAALDVDEYGPVVRRAEIEKLEKNMLKAKIEDFTQAGLEAYFEKFRTKIGQFEGPIETLKTDIETLNTDINNLDEEDQLFRTLFMIRDILKRLERSFVVVLRQYDKYYDLRFNPTVQPTQENLTSALNSLVAEKLSINRRIPIINSLIQQFLSLSSGGGSSRRKSNKKTHKNKRSKKKKTKHMKSKKYYTLRY